MRFPKRRADWRLGRWTAKCALSTYLDVPAVLMFFRKWNKCSVRLARPKPFSAADLRRLRFHSVIAAGGACTVEAPGVELGCDLEFVEPRSDNFVADYFTIEEQALVAHALAADRLTLSVALERERERTESTEGRPSTRHALVIVDPLRHVIRPTWLEPTPVRHIADHSAGVRVFHGWWQSADQMVRTVVSAPPPDAPIPLTTPTHFFDEASDWKPVAS